MYYLPDYSLFNMSACVIYAYKYIFTHICIIVVIDIMIDLLIMRKQTRRDEIIKLISINCEDKVAS